MNNRYILKKDEMALITKLTEKLIGSTTVEGKEELINNRFNKIIRDFNYKISGEEIIDGLKKGLYKQEFINVFTTNTTRFFREPTQFDWLFNVFSSEGYGKIKIWSSASSSGEEAHTIASVMQAKKELNGFTNDFEIIGTDISTKVLDIAKSHEYMKMKVNSSVPKWIENVYPKYWENVDDTYLKSKNILNQKLIFKQANLLEQPSFSDINNIDILFCRNMLIYFNKDLQEKIIKNIFSKLKVGGFLLLGHSETPWGLNDKIEKLNKYHNVFRKVKN